jgi:histidine kinase
MMFLRRLPVRLFFSYLAVVLVGALTLAVTLSLLAPSAFDHRMMGGTGTGMGSGGGMGMGRTQNYHDAFVSALRTSLPLAVLVSVGVAAAAALVIGRKILQPIDDVRHATARMIDGHYDERIVEPAELELAALARDVNGLAASLENTERRRGELIGEVAHEMRTPLTTIEGYVEGLLDGVFEPTEEVLTALGEETARLRRLAGDLASLSRAEEGALDLALEPADLTSLASQVASRLRPQFDAKGVRLDVRAEQKVRATCDAGRIAQVLTNLLGNALTYTPEGGTVAIAVERTTMGASVIVTDSGAGLAQEDLSQVFERFYRVPGVARPSGGSGIGLTIARSLARAHGGDVTASSAGPGKGATFTLTLP